MIQKEHQHDNDIYIYICMYIYCYIYILLIQQKLGLHSLWVDTLDPGRLNEKVSDVVFNSERAGLSTERIWPFANLPPFIWFLRGGVQGEGVTGEP